MAVEILDQFTETSDTNLVDHTSAPTGGQVWVEEVNTLPETNIAQVNAAGDYVFLTGQSGNQKCIWTARPKPSGADYNITYDVLQRDTNDDDTHWIVGRYTDADTFYAAGGANNGDVGIRILVKNGPTATVLEQVVDDFTVFTYEFQISDAAKVLIENGIEIARNEVDNSVTAAGSAGLGWGHIGVNSGYSEDPRSDWHGDNFEVDVVSGAPVVGQVVHSPVQRMSYLLRR